MKKILTISLFILIIIFTACNKTPDIEPIGFTYGDIDFTNEAEFFDLERASMPSEDQIRSIKKGMSIKDIIYVLGRPHDGGNYVLGYSSLEWHTESGTLCRISYSCEPDDPYSLWKEIYKIGESVRVDVIPPLSEIKYDKPEIIWKNETISFEDFFDGERKYIPTIEQVSRITSNMRLQEVIAIIGKPHEDLPTAIPTLIWYIDDNMFFSLRVNIGGYEDDEEYGNLAEWMYYKGVVRGLSINDSSN
jgi:outer membrane protein assembly factor BamE (lipoprotein component of BamABCDE complex)